MLSVRFSQTSICLALFFLLFSTPPVHAQGGSQIRFEQFTTEHGLAGNWIRGGITQDQHGFVWIATQNGLSRFDGYQFKNYQHQQDDPNSLSNDSIRAIDIDDQGRIWLATGAGLNKFDSTTETFTHYQHNPDDPASLSDNDLRNLMIDRDGVIWTGTADGGVNRFDPTTETSTHYQHTPNNPTGLGSNRVTSLYEDSLGQLWVGTRRGLHRFNPSSQTFTAYRHNPADPTSLSDNTISIIFEDTNGVLWVGTNDGLNRFDQTIEMFTRFHYNLNDDTTLSGDNIHIVAPVQAEPGLLWIGTGAGGLNKFDPATGASVRYQHDPQLPTSLSDNNVTAIFTDQSGVVWIGTRNGLNKFAPFSQQFPYYTQQPGTTNTLSDDLVQAIYQDETGVVWLGTDTGGLNRFDRATGLFTHYRHNPNDPNTPLSDDVEVIEPGEPGVLWLGYSVDGLSKFEPATTTFTHYLPDDNNPNSIASGRAQRSMYYDHTGDILWIGLDGGGLARLDPATETFTAYRHRPNEANSLSSDRVRQVYQDRTGMIWVGGTVDPVLNKLDLATGTMTRYIYETDEPDFRINTLHQAPNGVLWVGTRSGLLKFDPSTGDFFEDDETALWADKYIAKISVDQTDNYWLGVESNLIRYNPRTKIQTSFDDGDGFISCCRGWFFNEQTGELFTSGSEERGFHIFTANQLQARTYQPPLALTGFQLFGRPVPIDDESPLQQAIFATSDLTLAYSDNFAFEFAALDYAGPENIQYQYRLDGFEDDWNTVGPERRYAAYTSLPAGNYTFRVRATNSEGQWDEQEIALSLTIIPPWWESLWFRAAALLSVVALAYGGYRWRVWQIQQRNYFLEQQVAERTQELEASEARFRGLATSTFEAVIIHDQGQILDANQAVKTLLGYSREELVGKHVNQLIAPGSHQLVAQQMETDSDEPYEIEGITKVGAIIPLEVRAKMVPFQGRQVRVTAARDLTERRQIEAHKQRLAALEERERIGRDLHDDLGQVMGYVSIQVQTAQEFLKQGQANKVKVALTQLIQVANEAHSNVRQYILGVRTATPTQPPQSFFEQLTRYLEQLREQYNLEVQVSWPDDAITDSLLSPEVETQLLRIIQEALTNVRKHAGVNTARILFTLHADEIQIVISDEGVGFSSQGLGVRGQGLGVGSQGLETKRGEEDEVLQGTESLAKSDKSGGLDLSDEQTVSEGGAIRPDSTDEASGSLHTLEHRRRVGPEQHQGIHSVSDDSEGFIDGVGDATDYRGEAEVSTTPTARKRNLGHRDSRQDAQRPDHQPEKEDLGVRSQGLGAREQETESLTPNPQPPIPNSQSPTPSFGLEIMRERAESVGGSLDVRSELGRGTRVIVQMPTILDGSPETEVRGLRVLLVDDHPLYLEGLRTMLSARGVQVVGVAHDGLEAQQLARQLLPDLILMDVEMPRCNGLEATRHIKLELPDIKIVMLTVAADDVTLFNALKNGAAGYLLKSLDGRQFFTLLTEVMRGEMVLSPTLAAQVLSEFAHPQAAPISQAEEPPVLTTRQHEVLELVAGGASNREIADALHITERTVKFHVGQILERLQLRNRYELAQFAQQQQLVSSSEKSSSY